MGFNNVACAGTAHCGKSAGGNAWCGSRRAHLVYARKDFETLSEEMKCKRCAAKVAKRKLKAETVANIGDVR